ncbi:TonB family protein [Hymenobacter sp. BT186]|uniref:TonB family protein n=1 Tax=Hymenobacter telluris TaxID=2816474 RepID=A0A939JAX9_9BACT|nr:TonB family protein [Hymenobacter telluris]MBO0360324.1 TonB family protein [Hymenobacter telluris]MBW3376351.1 energy transducer TonB [Hymenobacter norwichensis]
MFLLSSPVRHRLLAGLLVALPLLPVTAQTKSAAKKAPIKTTRPATATAVPETVYETYQVQIKPEYAAGQFALQQYLKSARLPAEVKEGRWRIEGTVQINFVVRSDGRLTDVFVARGLSAATNAEALRLIQAMPRWRPGRRNDEAVATRYALEVRFQNPREATLDSKGNMVQLQYSGSEKERKAPDYVEQMPVFPGGTQALLKYIQDNIKYPALALRNQVEGKVFVGFIIGMDGSISDVELYKGIGSGCDEEAVRVISSLPRFEPGKQNGRTVAVSYTVPVTFSVNPTPVTDAATTPPAPVVPEDKVYTYVEQMPTIPGANNSVSISTALQAAVVLPAEVREGKSEGQVYVNFVVRPDGSTSDAKVVRSLCPACDQAALAAVQALPRLAPGKQNGQTVAVQLTVPVVLYGPNHVFESYQVATQAAFPGDAMALRNYLTEKLREPKVLKQENLAGFVEVRFVVQADGKVGAAEIVRPLCRSCDEEALRLVRDMPRWTPARNAAGQPVAVRQSVRIQMPAPPAKLMPGSTGQVKSAPAFHSQKT